MKTESQNTKLRTDLVDSRNRVPVWVMPVFRLIVIALDMLISGACFIAAFLVRDGNRVLSPTAWAWSKSFVPYVGILLFAIAIRPAVLGFQRAYQFYGAFSYTQEAIKIFNATLISSLLIVAWAFLFRGGFVFREFSYSRGLLVLDFVFALVVLTAFHLGLRFVQTVVRERGINLIPTLIVGTNAEARQTMHELATRKYLGYRVFGVIDGSSPGDVSGDLGVLPLDDGSEMPVLGTVDDLADVIRQFQIQEVIITDTDLESERLFEAMMLVGRKQHVGFRFAPTLFNVLPQKTSIDQIGVLPMVRLFREPLGDAARFIKRASDLALAVFVSILVLPLSLLLAVLIKLGSRGGVLFRQERVGMDGRIFLCYKFRTMYSDSDDMAHRDSYRKNIEGDAEANAGDDNRPVFGKVRDDPRITKTGRWLRRSSLDELPQILNVFRGDMSFVGPRPPIPYEVESYQLWHRKRLDVKPGITGLWQVSGRNRLSFDEMVKIDIFYVKNWSLWMDLKILLLTLPAMLRGDGAR